MLKPVKDISFGCDPEGFFQKGGKIIGAEKVIPADGLTTGYGRPVVLDGVQFELNPQPRYSVRDLAQNISGAFGLLKNHLKSVPEVTCCWKGVIEVEREELDSLSPKSRILGCAPSENVYGHKPFTIDPKTYPKRSAGGHLHLGVVGTNFFDYHTDERSRLVPLLDIFVGNTCVLLDRDPNAAERRQNYGRAGEHRKPTHGLEYRTLSNFWLKDYSLMSLVFSLAEIAIATLNTTILGQDLEQELVDTVKDIKPFVTAIDTNDFDLAWANLEKVRPFLARHLPETGFQIAPTTINNLIRFAQGVRDGGLEKFFPADPIDHWTGTSRVEFKDFLKGV